MNIGVDKCALVFTDKQVYTSEPRCAQVQMSTGVNTCIQRYAQVYAGKQLYTGEHMCTGEYKCARMNPRAQRHHCSSHPPSWFSCFLPRQRFWGPEGGFCHHPQPADAQGFLGALTSPFWAHQSPPQLRACLSSFFAHPHSFLLRLSSSSAPWQGCLEPPVISTLQNTKVTSLHPHFS